MHGVHTVQCVTTQYISKTGMCTLTPRDSCDSGWGTIQTQACVAIDFRQGNRLFTQSSQCQDTLRVFRTLNGTTHHPRLLKPP